MSREHPTSVSYEKKEAIRQAIEVEGRGYLGINRSGDYNGEDWPWYSDSLFPTQPHTRGPIESILKVYKHIPESKHIILDRILESNVQRDTVPNELDTAGREALAPNIATRKLAHRWIYFERDISRQDAYASKVTILMKMDARALNNGSIRSYEKRLGGNLHSFLFKVGKGMTAYFASGETRSELTHPLTGFDGGVGDLRRYLAQSLYFLAGYILSPCDTSCLGLPVVDSANRMTGEVWAGTISIRPAVSSRFHFYTRSPGFSLVKSKSNEATLFGLNGRVISNKKGSGKAEEE